MSTLSPTAAGQPFSDMSATPSPCLNCGYALAASDCYCPCCGQHVTKRPVSYRELFRSYFESLYNYDSQLLRSIRPFFLQPGKLTQTYLQGRRVYYIPPIKLYFVTSLLFFLSLGQFLGKVEPMSPAVMYGFLGQYLKQDSLRYALAPKQQDGLRAIQDSSLSQGNPVRIPLGGEGVIDLSRLYYLQQRYPGITEQQAADSLGLKLHTYRSTKIYERSFLLLSDRGQTVLGAMLGNISVAVLLLLPLLALMLKVFGLKRPYLHYLVGSIHWHAFLFVLLGVSLWVPDDRLLFLSVAYGLVYAFLMCRRLYGKGIWNTLLRMGVVGSGYMMVFMLVMLSEILYAVLYG